MKKDQIFILKDRGIIYISGADCVKFLQNIVTNNIQLLNYIINNYKNESEIKNFQLFQQLQEQIRKTLLLHEPISILKAFLSVTNKNENWNKVNPPLIKILHPVKMVIYQL